MSITREELERIAGLASLKLDTADVDRLTREIGDILDYVDRLGAADTSEAGGFRPGPAQAPMRKDEVGAERKVEVGDISAHISDGLYRVPQVGGLEE